MELEFETLIWSGLRCDRLTELLIVSSLSERLEQHMYDIIRGDSTLERRVGTARYSTVNGSYLEAPRIIDRWLDKSGVWAVEIWS